MIFYLTWFEKTGDGLVGEVLLSGVGEDDVRKVFDLKPDEYPGDCLEVTNKQTEWVTGISKCVAPRLELFEFFVEARAED